ncbi:MAG: patatin-like phospholipase family protein [Treponemataceae bacterium]|nr:patatin-like phospholipase family protein [Treponemataceae bacterium]
MKYRTYGFARLFLTVLMVFLSVSFVSAQIPSYGLVLSGGGGKGAYEVGVWKALNEYGIAQRVTEISGSSVGGLNGALFACTDVKEAERIWTDFVPQYLQSDEEPLISQTGLRTILDMVPLYRLSENAIPRVTVCTVRHRGLILGTSKFLTALVGKAFGERGMYAHYWTLNGDDTFNIKQELLATSAFPQICDPVELKDGYKYTDGGNSLMGGDNVPAEPISRNIDKLIVVYLTQRSEIKKNQRIDQIDWDPVPMLEIFPSIDLGGLFRGTTNFSASRIRMLIDYGYNDTKKVLEQAGYSPVSSFW